MARELTERSFVFGEEDPPFVGWIEITTFMLNPDFVAGFAEGVNGDVVFHIFTILPLFILLSTFIFWWAWRDSNPHDF